MLRLYLVNVSIVDIFFKLKYRLLRLCQEFAELAQLDVVSQMNMATV